MLTFPLKTLRWETKAKEAKGKQVFRAIQALAVPSVSLVKEKVFKKPRLDKLVTNGSLSYPEGSRSPNSTMYLRG